MKKILAIVATLCGIIACGTLTQTPEELAQDAAKVQQRLDSRRYIVNINYVRPSRGAGSAVTSSYSLTVNEGKVVSYLPYFGVARNLPYGVGNGLNFKGDISNYQELKAPRDRRRILFTTSNGDDTLTYQLDVFDNGRASISVRSNNRDTIDYDGYLDPDTDPAEEAEE